MRIKIPLASITNFIDPGSHSTATDVPKVAIAQRVEECDSTDPMALKTNSLRVANVHYSGESATCLTIRGNKSHSLPSYSVEGSLQDIKYYLARPRAVGTFSCGPTTDSPAYSLNINQAYIRNMSGFSRVVGAYGLRFTCVFRLQVSANPFAAGILRLTWIPQAGSRNHFDVINTCSVSQMPGVDLNYNEKTELEFKVPWVNREDFMLVSSINTVQYDLGTFRIFNYAPLSVASGGTAPTCVVWFSIEDLELIGATNNNVVTITTQSGLSTLDQEHAGGGGKTETGAAASPSISSLSGASRGSKGIAASMGFSYGWAKPNPEMRTSRILQSTYVNQNTADGEDTVVPMGSIVDNHIVPLPGFAGSDIDEMTFDYILSTPAAIMQPSWNITQDPGTNIALVDLSPLSMWWHTVSHAKIFRPYTPVVANTYLQPTPLYYLGNCFMFWRGNFVFRLKLAKTSFHVGRLLISYTPMAAQQPFVTYGAAAPTSDPTDSMTTVWDIKGESTLDFRVPYVAPNPYTPVSFTTGSFGVWVLDKLAAPTSVATSLPLTIEVFAEPDFEFAYPRTPYLQAPSINAVGNPITTQSGITQADMCIGERLMSIKQLMNKGTPTALIPVPAGTPTENIFPSFYVVPYNVAGIPVPFTSWSDYFAPMYVFARGSTIFDFLPRSRDVVLTVQTSEPSSPYVTTGFMNSNYEEPLGNSMHVHLPYYNYNSRSLISATAESRPNPNLHLIAASATLSAVRVLRRLSDDAQLGYFIGAPPLAIPMSPVLRSVAVSHITPSYEAVAEPGGLTTIPETPLRRSRRAATIPFLEGLTIQTNQDPTPIV